VAREPVASSRKIAVNEVISGWIASLVATISGERESPITLSNNRQ
jgi:hypothetical protein